MGENTNSQGRLFIISAASGAGKTSVVRSVIKVIENLSVSVSHTTRKARPNDKNGVDYHFITVEQFEEMKVSGDFLESAKVYDNYYGTSKTSLNAELAKGNDVILEIDWQGARSIRELYPNCISIFILPPSLEDLTNRLQARDSDSAETIALRLEHAKADNQHYDEYEYLIVNDYLPQSIEECKHIVLGERLKRERQELKYADILPSLK